MSAERFIISIGKGKFAVVAGHKLNAEPLSRAEADRLAHEPVRCAENSTSASKKSSKTEGVSAENSASDKPAPKAPSPPTVASRLATVRITPTQPAPAIDSRWPQRSLRASWTPAAVRAAETVTRGLQTTDGTPAERCSVAAVGKSGCGMCSAAARH
jgi:hypothetical protein